MRFLFNSLQNIAIVLFLYTLLGSYVQAEGENDDEFARHLEKVMKDYTRWLRENDLDPSPPIENVLKSGLYERDIQFDCVLSNHYVVGQSELSHSTVGVSNFTGHDFAVEKITTGLYESYGEFNCTGVLADNYFPSLSQDLPFSGHGKFRITTNSSLEFLKMMNVGITQDYTLDLSKIWMYYQSLATPKSVQLKGQWNDSRIAEKYFASVQAGFGRLYDDYPFFYDDQPSFPTAQLLERYLRERMQGFDLREILGTDNLPNPYTPITTTTTTTTTTTKGSSSSTTSSTTTEPTTPDSAGQKVMVETAGLICTQFALFLCIFFKFV